MGRLLLLISRNTNVACMSLLLMVAYVPCEYLRSARIAHGYRTDMDHNDYDSFLGES